MNYVFYVSDMDAYNDTSYSYKMESERDIAFQISRGLGKCIVQKYTEYNGELIDADSVGIVFPSRRWGMSIAVYTFLQNIKVTKNTYIYAVAAGENVSGKVDLCSMMGIKTLDQIKRALSRRFICTGKDIYVRCTDRERSIEDTEYNMFGVSSCDNNIKCILNGLLFKNLEQLENSVPMEDVVPYSVKKVVLMNDRRVEPKRKTYKLTNIFLDDDVFAEDKLCRVI